MKRFLLAILVLLFASTAQAGFFSGGGTNSSSSGSGDVATDAIWDAAGDLAVGSGANTVARLAHPGAANYILYSNAATTIAWLASSANMISLLGSANYAIARTNLGLAIGTNVQAYNANLTSWAAITAPTVAAAGDLVVGSGASALTVISKGANNSIFGVNNSGTLGYYTNIKTDDSAAQFYSATASKGTLKVLLSGSTDAKLLTLQSNHTDNRTITLPDATATLAILGGNAFTGTNSFAGDTTIGDAGSGDKTKINLDAVGIADAEFNGTTITLACGEDITAPAPVYVKSDGKAWLANAAAAATMPAIGLMVETCDVDASESKKILIHGVYRKDASYAFTVGGLIYVDDSAAGVLTGTVGDVAGTDHVVQVFGLALDADYLLVNPSLTTITLE